MVLQYLFIMYCVSLFDSAKSRSLFHNQRMRLRWRIFQFFFASLTLKKQRKFGNWKFKKEVVVQKQFNFTHPCVSRIFPLTFVCASAANSTLSNQFARVHMETKKKFLCFVLPPTKKILRQFFFVGRQACAGGEIEAKKI